jgi:CCR4-NOT transcriptional regulation complex NOT5 subunit
MAASKKSKPQTKTGFILALPAEMSPKEVVAKAKEAGIELSEKYVSTIRSNARAKKKAKRAAAKAAPAKKVATKTSKKAAAKNAPVEAAPAAAATAPTATDFIGSQPRDIPAAAVVKAARKVGITVSVDYVYKVRSRLAAKGSKAPAPKAAAPKLEAAPKAPKAKTAPATKAAAPKPAAKGGTSNIEGSFKRLVVELGVARATELVGDVRKTLAELFGAE